MRSNEIEAYKKTLKLTKTQRSIIVGTLLGDGHLETQNGRKAYRLKIEHASGQEAYAAWLYEQLQDWVRTPLATKQKQVAGVTSLHFWFQTLSVVQFRFYGLQFYDDQGQKRVPKIIRRLLTPLALAVWFMDDGLAKSKHHRAVILNTQCFKRRDIIKLQDALAKRYGLETSIRIQKDGLQILITGEHAHSFMMIVAPYMLPSFSYKFGALVNNMPKEYRRRSKVG
jgi:recombination protein RecA